MSPMEMEERLYPPPLRLLASASPPSFAPLPLFVAYWLGQSDIPGP